MRLRGRRIALLLASALPLLADEATTTSPETKTQQRHQQEQQKQQLQEDDENDFVPLTAVEAIHDDGFKLPSLPNSEILLPETHISMKQQHLQQQQPRETNHNDDDNVKDPDTKDRNMATSKEEKTHQPQKNSGEILASKKDDLPPLLTENSQQDDLKDNETAKNMTKHPSTVEVMDNQQNDYNITATKSILDKKSVPILSEPDPSTVSNNNETPVVVPKNETAEEKQIVDKKKIQDDATDDDEESLRSRVSVDYASKSAGALIIEKSKSFKGTSNLLNGDKDRYAIAPCEDKKFVVISLSEDILVKTVKLANYERFSSTVKDFQILGSQTLGKWVDLGTYSAAPGNGEQIFELREPTWARYLKFKFLSHHGVEYYCTYSQIQVHGSTMVQGFHEQWEEDESSEEADSDDDAEIFQDEEANGGPDVTVAAGDNPSSGTKLEENSADIVVDGNETGSEDTSVQQIEEEGNSVDGPKNPNESKESPQTCSSGTNNHLLVLPFAQFCTSDDLDAMLHGRIEDGALFSELYDLIPSTLMTLPSASRESPGRKTSSESGLMSFHNLGSMSIKSLFSSSQTSGNGAEAQSTGTIAVPKMSDAVEEIMRLGRGLATRVNAHTAKVETSNVKEESRIQNHMEKDPELGSEKNAVAVPNKNEGKSLGDESISDAVIPQVETPEKKTAREDKENLAVQSQDGPHVDSLQVPAGNVDKSRDPPTPGVAQDSFNDIEMTLAKLLEDLPSADCLKGLNFAELKAKAMASRKSASGSGSSHSGGAMEPIFKKLTDEIRSLQTSLSVHEQFAKTSAACYQRVLFDLIVEAERKQIAQDQRLSRLEDEFKNSQSFFLFRILGWVLQGVYSAFIYLYSMLLAFIAAFVHFGVLLFRTYWPLVRKAILLCGNWVGMTDWFVPVIRYVDRLLGHPDTHEATAGDGVINRGTGQGAVFFLGVPAIVLLVFCRALMNFGIMYHKRTLLSVETNDNARAVKKSPSSPSPRGVPDLVSDLAPDLAVVE